MKKLFFSMLAMFAFASTAMAQGPKIFVNKVLITDGSGTVTVQYEFDKDDYYGNFQFDILLPEEVTADLGRGKVKADASFSEAGFAVAGNVFEVDDAKDINNGKKVVRFIASCNDGYAIIGTTGTLFTFPLKADASLNEVFEATLNNGKINVPAMWSDGTDNPDSGKEFNLPDQTFSIYTGNTTVGISEIQQQAEQGPVYNLNGQRVQKAQKGLYIENGKKVVKK